MRIPLLSRSLNGLSPACFAIALSLPLPLPATADTTVAAAASSPAVSSQYDPMSLAREGAIVLAQLAAVGLEIVTEPRSQTAVLGSEVTFCVTASGGAPISYLWLRDGLPLTGADQSCLTLTDVTASDEGSYSVIVSDGKTSEWSDEAQLTIVPVGATPSIKIHPSSQTVTTGGTATLSVVAESTEPMQYQWYTGQSGDKNSPVTGATGATFTTPALTATSVFWVQVTTTAGTADSKSATITIVSPAAPQITQQPESQTVFYGSLPELKVLATGAEPLSYGWYEGQTGDKRKKLKYDGAGNVVQTYIPVTATTAYWVEVTNSVGVAVSQTATLTVITSRYEVVHYFGFSDTSAVHPRSPVIEGSDGLLYGTTTMGGSAAHGAVFRMKKDGTEFAVLKGFEGSDGSSPLAALMEGSDGSLYGTTAYGGWGDAGTVFKLNKDGTGYQVIKHFTPFYGVPTRGETQDGAVPLAALIEGTDGSLYGTTSEKGEGGRGTVFKLNEDGSGYQILVHFKYRNGSSVPNDGERPAAPLLEGSDGALYGTTQSGGVGGRGTIFKLNKDGTGYRTLKSLSSDGAEGSGPCEALLEGSDGALFGGAWSRSSSVMFRLNKDGTGYTVLKRWSPEEPRPAWGPLLKANDGGFFGATLRGTNGMQQWGALFWVNSDGSGFKVLTSVSLEGYPGQVEYGVWLAQGIDGELYGTTSYGGNADRGTVLSVNQDGSGFRVLRELSLNTADGRGPYAGVIEGRDGALYGTTRHGGSANSGTVYGIDKNGSNYRLLWSFQNGRDGSNPTAPLLEASDGLLYGTAKNGGFGDNGTLFRINKHGTAFEVVKLFLGVGGEGAHPTAAAIEGRDGALYGTTQDGGSGQNGTVYKVNKDGTGFQTLVSFPPLKNLVATPPKPGVIEASDGALYGTFSFAPIWQGDSGVVFKVNKDGTGYQKLATLAIPTDWGFGVAHGLLEGSDGQLYGTVDPGGWQVGAMFRLNKDGTGYTALPLESKSTGVVPTAALVEGLDGALYGPASELLYKINKDGTGLLALKRFWGPYLNSQDPFDADEGLEPMGALLKGSDWGFYGTTYSTGGKVNDLWAEKYGTVYRLAVNHGPAVTRPIPDQKATVGFAFSYTFPKDVFSDPDSNQILCYTAHFHNLSEFSFNPASRTFSGTPTNAIWGTIDLVATDSGNPALSVTNSFAVNVSRPSGPRISEEPKSQMLTNGSTARFLVIATGTEPLYYQWYEGKAGDKTRAVAGATAATFTTQALTNSTAYWVQVTNALGSANSQTATVTIQALTPPTITFQPESRSIPTGNSVTLRVLATGTDPLAYQWYAGQTGDKGLPIVGATSASLTTSELTTESAFWVEVSNAGGVAQSATATLTIAPPTAPEIIWWENKPYIIGFGIGLVMNVYAVGAKPFSYQWYRRGNGELSVPVPGATNAQFITHPITVPTAFWVRVSNAGGSADTDEKVIIPVGTVPASGPPNITFQPTDRTVKQNGSALLLVVATGSEPLKYQWYVGESGDKSGPVTGATSFVYDVSRLTKTTSYWVQVTNALGAADSQTATISVVAPPTITQQPQSQTINSGSAVALEVAATGTEPLAYHWFEGQRGDMSRPLPGATAASFTSPALTNTTTYWVQVTNAVGVADSQTATITVVTPPVITVQPHSQTITSGGTATLTVVATGAEPFGYQWYVGESGDITALVPGAAAASFTTPVLTNTTAYWVRVSNVAGVVNSQTATIVVTPATPAEVRITDVAMALDTGKLTFSWAAEAGRRYRVQFKDRLTDPAWTDLAAEPSIEGTRALFIDDIRGAPERYYRVRMD